MFSRLAKALYSSALIYSHGNTIESKLNGNVITVEGTQSEHTTNIDGKYRHPFADLSPDVSTIENKESGTFTVRLNQKQGKSKYHKTHKRSRWRDHMKHIVNGEASSFLGHQLSNFYDLFYVGEIQLGSEK